MYMGIRLSSGNCALSSANSASGSNFEEVRKKNWGELLGNFPSGKKLEYLARLSGLTEMLPLYSLRMKWMSLTSPLRTIS